MKQSSIQKDNNGFTLVELIISFAILVIVTLAVVGMMVTGMRFFRTTTSNVGLQYEYQTVMTQLREYIVDCNGGVAVEGNTLYIVNKTEKTTAGPTPIDYIEYETLVFHLDGQNLYFVENEPAPGVIEPFKADDIPADIDLTAGSLVFSELSQRMTDFTVTIDYITIEEDDEDKDIAVLVATDMGFASGNRSYRALQEIALRNRNIVAYADTYAELQLVLDLM